MNQREQFVDMLLRTRNSAEEGQEETAKQGAQLFAAVYDPMTFGTKQQKSDAGYPKLTTEGSIGVAQLFQAFIAGPQPTFQAWETTTQEVARVMHRSTWSVKQTLASMRDQLRLSRSGDAGPWAQGRRATTTEQPRYSYQDFVCAPEQ